MPCPRNGQDETRSKAGDDRGRTRRFLDFSCGICGEMRWEIEKVLSLLFDCLDLSGLKSKKQWIFVNVRWNGEENQSFRTRLFAKGSQKRSRVILCHS